MAVICLIFHILYNQLINIKMSFKHGSLFSGIGGFDLAAEWMGWDNIFHCEWNDFGKQVLKYYWPNAISYDDITKTDFTIHRGTIDILTGGFPCQPYSQAGKRKGKEDERHLWPEMLRAIGEIQPRWVVGENVLGLVNWNGGLVFDEVQADLEIKGYEVQPFILPACGLNAPHRRERVWFVAHRNSDGQHRGNGEHGFNPSERGQYAQRDIIKSLDNGLNSDTNGSTAGTPGADSEIKSNRCQNNDEQKSRGIEGQQHIGCGELLRIDEYTNGERLKERIDATIADTQKRFGSKRLAENWLHWPTQPPVCDGNDGISPGLDGITFSTWRNESIKGGGNAIVPQVVHQIFKAIDQYENTLT